MILFENGVQPQTIFLLYMRVSPPPPSVRSYRLNLDHRTMYRLILDLRTVYRLGLRTVYRLNLGLRTVYDIRFINWFLLSNK